MNRRDRQMFEDLLHAADATGLVGRCPGGRFTLQGYVCIHCGADFSDGDPCLQPMLESGEIGKRPLVAS